MDNCPKCGRDLLIDGGPYSKRLIVQYLGVREQHMADDPTTGGCGWGWSGVKDRQYAARVKPLVDKWNETHYQTGTAL